MESSILDLNLHWGNLLRGALAEYLHENCGDLDVSHTVKTPVRVQKFYQTMVAGEKEDPQEILGTRFDTAKHDQMIIRRNIRVVSTCAHHILPFVGKATFAYVPNEYIVGISKIPRLVRCFSRRLQVQERLTDQIVDAFQDIVKPYGCALSIKAYHFCEIVRGAEEYAAPTETTALRGTFKTNPETRAEFLRSVDKQETIFP